VEAALFCERHHCAGNKSSSADRSLGDFRTRDGITTPVGAPDPVKKINEIGIALLNFSYNA